MLLIITVLLVLLLLIPVGVDLGYCEGELQIKLRASAFTMTVYPTAKQQKRKAKKQNSGTESKTRALPDFTKDEVLDGIGVAVKSVRKLRFSLHKLKLHFISAFEDPYQTAMVYGYASAAVNAFGLPQLKRADVQLGVDFEREACFVDGYVSVTIKIYYIVKLICCLMVGLIPIFWQRHRRLKANVNSVAVKGKVV